MHFLKNHIHYLAWATALVSLLGSLFFSNVLRYPPCVLCWYQRIAMYPLAIILTVGVLRKDKLMYLYVLPLSIIGLVIAIYHNLLYYKILPESISACTVGVSCATKQLEWLGFITIPLLSLIAFTIITIGMVIYKQRNKYEL